MVSKRKKKPVTHRVRRIKGRKMRAAIYPYKGDAPCIDVLQAQIKTMFPGRVTGNDGTLGDAAHRARESDHNPNKYGIVTAVDFTHDLRHGFDSWKFADLLRQKCLDKVKGFERIEYVISNRRIFNLAINKAWRKYTGPSPHTEHCHISINDDPKLYNDTTPWDLSGYNVQPDPAAPIIPVHRTLKRGDTGDDVKVLQNLLRFTGDAVDGDYGKKTESAVKAFQKKTKGLVADGVCGNYTWTALEKK